MEKLPEYRIIFSKLNNRSSKMVIENVLSKKEFNTSIEFGAKVSIALYNQLPAYLQDLYDIVVYIYYSDRLTYREYYPSWTRKIHLKIPVREFSYWKNNDFKSEIIQLLRYLTEDIWDIEFVDFSKINLGEQRILFPFETSPNSFISLFSGGLDSFAGNGYYLTNHKYDIVYLFSIVTNGRMYNKQKDIINFIKYKLSINLVHVPIKLKLQRNDFPEHLEEKSQRSRGFLFLVLGSIFTFWAKQNQLNLFENGIGAINLPYSSMQIGTDNSRSVNPITLIKLSKLLSKIFNTKFEIQNRAQWKTKSEMCGKLKRTELINYINNTISCDNGFSRRIKKNYHCGHCTSCLLRRQALATAGLLNLDINNHYEVDIFNPNKLIDDEQPFELEIMREQIKTIGDCIKSTEPWNKLIDEFPSLFQINLEISKSASSNVGEDLNKEKLLNLYSTYLYEWYQFEELLKN